MKPKAKGTMIYFDPQDLEILRQIANRESARTGYPPSVSRVVRAAVKDYINRGPVN